MIKVVVNMKQWLRGEGNQVSYLRRATDGKQCCVGFLARKLGATVKDITRKKILNEVSTPSTKTMAANEWETLDELYEINDDQNIKDAERMAAIRSEGRKMGVRFTFKR